MMDDETALFSLWKAIKRVLYRLWAGIYSRYQESFNPTWREPLPPQVCELCGKPGHKEAYCPNAKELGLLE